MGIGALIAIVIVLAGVIAVVTSSGTHHPAATNVTTTVTAAPGVAKGPESVPVPSGQPLADLSSAATGAPVDGISCNAGEKLQYHIHVHLSVFVNGQQMQIPPGIGIPGAQGQQTTGGLFVTTGTCFYWLHTHVADGIIHIESPTKKVYTLGNFFDIWGIPLSTSQVGPASGSVTAFVDGQPYTGDPAAVPLTPHRQIQLDVGTPVVPYQPIAFPSTL
jgi:hypothetical protein